MSNKSHDDLMKETRAVLKQVRGESENTVSPEEKSTGRGFKGFVKDWFIDLGEQEPKTVNEIPAEPLQPEVEFSVPSSGAGDVSFTDLYTEAGIESKFGVDQLEEMINDDQMKGQPLSFQQVAIPFAITAKGFTIDDVLEDAVNKDGCLDGYARTLRDEATNTEQSNTAKEETINAEMKEYFESKEAEIQQLRENSSEKKLAYIRFLDRKRVEEQRMANTIAPFLGTKPNPVTVGNEPTTDVSTEPQPQATAKA